LAASTVFAISILTVIGPTPPGTSRPNAEQVLSGALRIRQRKKPAHWSSAFARFTVEGRLNTLPF
jgi:hypothetical protein